MGLADLVKGTQDLESAKMQVDNERSLQAIERLEALYEVLKKYGTEKYVSFDLGLLNQYNYYTGVIFKGYTYGVGDAIVTGGRYDKLLSYFGKNAPAIGFVVVVDDVLEALSRQNKKPHTGLDGCLLFYTPDSYDAALKKANQLRLSGAIRTFNPEVRALIETEMRRMTEHIALAQGLGHEVKIDHLTPPLINSPVCADAAKHVASRLFGPGCPQPVQMSMAGEDFAEYANRIPGIQTYIGMADETHQAAIHNPKFDFNDEILPLAVCFLSEIARSRLTELTH